MPRLKARLAVETGVLPYLTFPWSNDEGFVFSDLFLFGETPESLAPDTRGAPRPSAERPSIASRPRSWTAHFRAYIPCIRAFLFPGGTAAARFAARSSDTFRRLRSAIQ
jgi:hypothetical protein